MKDDRRFRNIPKTTIAQEQPNILQQQAADELFIAELIYREALVSFLFLQIEARISHSRKLEKLSEFLF